MQFAAQQGADATHYQYDCYFVKLGYLSIRLVQLLAQRCEHVVQYLNLSKKKLAFEEEFSELEEVNIGMLDYLII
jgi:hypothetical protein